MHDDISAQHEAASLRETRIRTLNEIAFITSDRAHGGPPREKEMAELRNLLHRLDARICAAGGKTEESPILKVNQLKEFQQ